MVGAAPSFSEIHLIRALLLLKKAPIGRKKLVQLLGVGEGSTRTLLNKLKEEQLVASSKQGHFLTTTGQRKIRSHLKNFSPPLLITSEIVPGEKIAVVVHGVSKKIDKGLEERDIAVKAGASGAIIFTYHKKLHSMVPDFKLTDFPDLLTEIKKFNLKSNDVVVITFSDTLTSAENGALAIALHLLKK